MSPEQMRLARELLQCPQWKWQAGMLTARGHRLLRTAFDGDEWLMVGSESGHAAYTFDLDGDGDDRTDVPDLSDYATAAILLRMALEAGGEIDTNPGDARRWDDHLGRWAAEALLEAWGS